MGLRAVIALTSIAACGGRGDHERPRGDAAVGTSSCPATAQAPSPLPGVEPAERTLAYWLERTPDLDEVLLEPGAIADMNASLVVDRGDDWHGDYDLIAQVDRTKLERDVKERLTELRTKLGKGELVDDKGAAISDVAMFDVARLGESTFDGPELRVALEDVPLRCWPRVAGLFSKPAGGSALSTRYDRNNCSTAHAQEVVQVIARWPNGMLLARTRYATGWIAADAKLSPVIPDALREAFVHGPRATTDDDLALGGHTPAAKCPAGTLLPTTPEHAVRYADAAGFHEEAVPPDHLQSTRRPITRRAVLAEAFRFLDTPYGWGGGGANGGHDCSAYLMDLFATFDLHLPRHSAWQARAGTFSIDVKPVKSLDERARLLDAAQKRGVVLLSFPGHVMLYLGRNAKGTPMVLHALAEYAQACPGGGETVYQIDRITVSNLDLGRGSQRTSLFERITRITVIGKPPGVELAGAAESRPPAPVAVPAPKACRDSQDVALFTSPRVPNSTEPLRVIATANRDLGPVELTLVDPSGARIPARVARFAAGPPWSVIATADKPTPGTWTAILGDGSRVDACGKIAVRARPPTTRTELPSAAPVWETKRAWTRATENLYATFIQRLFDFPPDQDVTWPNLQTLLRDPEHNILINHLQRDEDTKLKLQPDCADLPFVLRAYFAWKLGLPYAYHRCTRGSEWHRPECREPFFTNLVTRAELDEPFDRDAEDQTRATATAPAAAPPPHVDDVDAFATFWSRHVSNTVHAATGRTVPDDEITDYYPLPLTRDALRPGAVYIDPFGHVMVVSAWVPQSATAYGVLLAADAQPDGTVGRKRFWRGNFLFSADTHVAGAGFKAFRPPVYSERDHEITLPANKDLRRSRVFAPFSLQQYEGNEDTFYDTVEALENPRPLDASAALVAIVDSLHSQAKLRVVSVSNAEQWVAQHPGQTIPMPPGADIFLTSGPWEDFATPSRDFRLLVAFDTVLGFPATVRRTPARFGLAPGPALDAAITRLQHELDDALASRSIEYLRSDGKTQKLTLKELVDRRAGFEVSYDPNDCVELRWAAPEGSPEAASCKRRAPADQQAKLAAARTWFHERKRPAK